MKINIHFVNIIVFLHILLQPSLCPLYSGIDLFKDPERLRNFIIETTKVPLFSRPWFKNQLISLARGFIVTSAASFVLSIISSKFGKPYMIHNAIKTALEEERKNDEVTENILGENKEITQFIKTVRQDNFKFNSILLFGPPGTGKTTFARWLAQQIGATLYPFAEIAGALKLKSFMGNKISPDDLLTYLVNMIKTRQDIPPQKNIILFDEFDILYKNLEHFKTFINRSDLIDDTRYNNTIFIATTNYIDVIPTPEIERFGNRIYVDYTSTWIKIALSMAIKNTFQDGFDQEILQQFTAFHNFLFTKEDKVIQNLFGKLERVIEKHVIQDDDKNLLPKLSLRRMKDAITHAQEKEIFFLLHNKPQLTPTQKAKLIAQNMYKELWFTEYKKPCPIPDQYYQEFLEKTQ